MIDIDLEGIEPIQRVIDKAPKEVRKVASRAINRAITSARTEAARGVRGTYRIKHGDVLKTIKIVKSSPGTLHADLTSLDSPIQLIKFSVSKNKRGLRAGVKKGSSKPIKSGFIINNARGGANAFVRLTPKRVPTKGLYGPSVPQMIGNEQIIDKISDQTTEMLMKRMEHEASRVLGG